MGTIQGSTTLLNSLQTTDRTDSIDRMSKELMRNKEVLAIILKGVVSEYADYDYREIMDFIEGSSIESSEVTPGRENMRIVGDDKEFVALGERTSIYDTKFRAVNPRLSTKELVVNLHVDVEP